jgi:putative pyruvate formate lyase activating enzyme
LENKFCVYFSYFKTMPSSYPYLLNPELLLNTLKPLFKRRWIKMSLFRREFIKNFFLAGGAGLLYLAGGAGLLQGCAWRGKPQNGTLPWQPAYAKLEAEGKLASRIEQAFDIMAACTLCPRRCGVNRLAGQEGFCLTRNKAVVFSAQPHFGEELPLVGRHGSGTIFFSNCNLRCVFCQNYPIAHFGWGSEITDEALADLMMELQARGCHNINLVTPTHVMPNILNATRIAYQQGLRLPLCYNTSGYERTEIVKLLDGIVDIYLPDIKFMDGGEAARFNEAAASDYPEKATSSTIEMNRQVGTVITDADGIALSGLMIRHLVMPNRVAGTQELVQWIAKTLPKDTYVNIMSQYRVEYRAFEFEDIARAITSAEFVEAMEWAKAAGLTNLDERSLSQLNVHRRLAQIR